MRAVELHPKKTLAKSRPSSGKSTKSRPNSGKSSGKKSRPNSGKSAGKKSRPNSKKGKKKGKKGKTGTHALLDLINSISTFYPQALFFVTY